VFHAEGQRVRRGRPRSLARERAEPGEEISPPDPKMSGSWRERSGARGRCSRLGK
jgi:hypothetical protein